LRTKIWPTKFGLVVSQGNIAPEPMVFWKMCEYLRFTRKSLMLPVFLYKIFYYCEKRCPLWSTKKCPNFLVYYSQPTTVWSLHICKWTYFHTFQIPFSFFIYSSISNPSGLRSPIVPVRCMSGDYTTNSIFPYLSSKDVENIWI